jgi:short-subunit dehydrogenase
MKKQKGTALITGATQASGRELAWCFARGGFDVVLVARDREALKVSRHASIAFRR